MNVFRLDGKKALVTGGAAGIGYSIVQMLVEAGAAVAIVDISEEGRKKVEQLVCRGYQALFLQADVTDSASAEFAVEQAVQYFGGLDILVNNAGIYPRAMLEETTIELWEQVMDINLKSMFLFCKQVVPHMRRRGGGAIVNMTSSHGVVGLPELFAYSVSKGGVNTLTRNLAGALALDRIRVNAVNPGWVATEKEIKEREAKGQSLAYIQKLGQSLPLGRMQTGEDTAAAIVYLVSDAASQLTGQILNVDGGKTVAISFDDRSLDVKNEDPK